ncbi:MAG: hypothetical protein CM15mP103_00190 [Gammaproteobacteria bacterium]|nr:MAG: hypothetical protein CM15mP103_00190 [Gammaproteobacteria bacterium]
MVGVTTPALNRVVLFLLRGGAALTPQGYATVEFVLCDFDRFITNQRVVSGSTFVSQESLYAGFRSGALKSRSSSSSARSTWL